MKKNKQKAIIVSRYIVLYECLLEDFFPMWKNFVNINELHIVKELINKFYINYEYISLHDLSTIENDFLTITRTIIEKLHKSTKNDILLNHFDLINKL